MSKTENNQDFEITKANYIAQLYAIAIAENFKANVWFSYTGWRNSGLVASDFSKNPAFLAYQVAQDNLGDSKFLYDINQDVRGYIFEQGDVQIGIFWSKNGVTQSYPIPENTKSVMNVFGEPLAINSIIEISAQPVYIVMDP